MKRALPIILLIVMAVVFVVIGLRRKGATAGRRHIAVIPKETASVYWEAVRRGAAKACEEEGYQMIWTGPEMETDREKQIQIVADAIAQRVAGIVLAPNDRKALVPSVEKIYANGIPCVIIDSGVETDKYIAFLATDNYRGGVIAAKRMGEILKGQGQIVMVRWTPNSASTDARAKGFTETIGKDFPGIKIVDAKFPNPPTVARARDITEDMLMRNSEVVGLFACNATTAGGALQALRSPAYVNKGIKMIGFDAWPMLIEGLKKGEIDSLVVQNPYRMGYEGVKTVIAKLTGYEVTRYVDTGVELVTKERLEEPKIKALLDLQ